MRDICWSIGTGFYLAITGAAPGQAELIYTPVAIYGQQPADTAAGTRFTQFENVQINNSGQVMFIGRVSGGGASGDAAKGLWLGTPGNLKLAVRGDDPAPGVPEPDATFGFIGAPTLGEDGVAVFYSILKGEDISEDTNNPGNDDSIWIVSTTDDPAPQVNPQLLLRAGEDYCFVYKDVTCAMRFWPYRDGIYLLANPSDGIMPDGSAMCVEDQLLLVGATRGQIITVASADFDNTESGITTIIGQTLVANATPAVGFRGSSMGNAGLWYGPPNGVGLVTTRNQQSPVSLPDSDNIVRGVGDSIGTNHRGGFAYFVEATTPTPRRSYLLAGTSNSPRVMARTVPFSLKEDEDGFLSFGSLVMNGSGDVAFVASHTSLEEYDFGFFPFGIWITDRDSAPRLGVAEGNTAPGLGQDEVISFIEDGPYMNRRGQVVIRAGIGSEPGFQNSVDTGLWIVDPVRGATLVARGGTMIDIGGGQMREVIPRGVSFLSSFCVNYSGREDGRPTVFNDLGQVVFIAQWVEPGAGFQSGVFVAGEVRVIEPVFDGENAVIAFPSSPGKQYRVEYRESAESGEWMTLQSAIAGDGNVISVTDDGAASRDKRFYRLVLE